jgi:choline dehydrogenase
MPSEKTSDQAVNRPDAAFVESVRLNQRKLSEGLRASYDFIVCGSGSSGAVVARRLAENPAAQVLLLEAGGDDDIPNITEPHLWVTNLGSERDWGFQARPNAALNDRILPLNMGKVLGGGSSINVMAWSRGHKNDWDYFAQEADDPAWNYSSVLEIYRRMEDWRGAPDPQHRGSGGPVFVSQGPRPNPIAPAMLEAARLAGIPTFDNQNGEMMESDGGASITDVRIHDGRRLSIFRSYTFPYMDRPNLTVLTHALVTRLVFDGKRVAGVEVAFQGQVRRIEAAHEVVLSLGAINSPKILMQSGIGDERELKRLGIPVVQHLPGVGQNFQDHCMVASCMWEYEHPLPPRSNASEATLFWKSDSHLDTPDMQISQIEVPFTSFETAKLSPPASAWGICPGIVRPKSRGRLHLTGPNPQDTVEIEANTLSNPDDLKAMIRCVELSRELGNSVPLKTFAKREVMPGNLTGSALEDFIRDGVVSYWHQTCTAKMGRDEMSVVDGSLKVYGIGNLRVADGSIMPRVTTGNTMAPCVVIGERAGEILGEEYKI